MNRGDAETGAGVVLFAGRFGQRQVDAGRARVLTARSVGWLRDHQSDHDSQCSQW